MRVISKKWHELEEREWPYPDEVFVCGNSQPDWPPWFVARMRGKKYPVDLQHLGLFWEKGHAAKFAEIVEREGL